MSVLINNSHVGKRVLDSKGNGGVINMAHNGQFSVVWDNGMTGSFKSAAHAEQNGIRVVETAYLVVPKADLVHYTLPVDREYFANPVLVEIIGEEDGLPIVKDHVRGHKYPCLKANLKSKYQLTKKQLAAAKAS